MTAEVGPGWVLQDEGELDAEDLVDARSRRVDTGERCGGPTCRDATGPPAAAAHVEAYREAVAARGRR